ncbi:hypothetical protein KSX_00670 [Ktedonospora formicarum]|uniref:Uncharacterized protein n=1 Tax=Ktedonospora formicarum TaxID=2778364 RepID=A0A8J3HZ27_9CHLR|nr:hypothetical protein KSX_00670 [Ktedonospora formicarum]
MWNIRQHRPNSIAQRTLSIRDHPTDRNVNRLLDLANQAGEVRFTRTEEASSQEHFSRETIAQDPKDFMPNIGLEAINGKDDLSWLFELVT